MCLGQVGPKCLYLTVSLYDSIWHLQFHLTLLLSLGDDLSSFVLRDQSGFKSRFSASAYLGPPLLSIGHMPVLNNQIN